MKYAKEACILAFFIAIFFVSLELAFQSASASNQTENKSSNLTQANSTETVGWQTYEDGENHYKMQYPQEWKKYESKFSNLSKDFVITPDTDKNQLSLANKTLVAVHMEDISKSLDPSTLKVQSLPLSEYAKEEIEEMSSGGEPDIITNEATTVSGEPAWRLDYIDNYKGYQLDYGSILFVVKDDKLYKISFVTAPPKVEETRPVGEKIIQTFQFTNNTG